MTRAQGFDISSLPPPLRRAAAGALAGFASCLAIQLAFRAMRLMSPIGDLGTLMGDVWSSAGWAALCLVAFLSLKKPVLRLVVLALLPLPLFGIVLWMNAPNLHGPESSRSVGVVSVLFLMVAGTSALLGNRLERSWREHGAA